MKVQTTAMLGQKLRWHTPESTYDPLKCNVKHKNSMIHPYTVSQIFQRINNFDLKAISSQALLSLF